jgi:hypothetical protein
MFETKYCTFILGLLGDVKRFSLPFEELFLERSISNSNMPEPHP